MLCLGSRSRSRRFYTVDCFSRFTMIQRAVVKYTQEKNRYLLFITGSVDRSLNQRREELVDDDACGIWKKQLKENFLHVLYLYTCIHVLTYSYTCTRQIIKIYRQSIIMLFGRSCRLICCSSIVGLRFESTNSEAFGSGGTEEEI